ncbi:hypothetical protein OAD61_00250 [bacterium]|nr:hypothetical protein [bacterium]
MLVTKAYILKINTPLSNAYAKTCADSCDKVSLSWSYYAGFQNQSGKMAFGQLRLQGTAHEPYRFIENPTNAQKAMCCSAGHYGIWKAIAEGPDEAAVILEHDAIILQPVSINIPDNQIVVLGYKLTEPSRYDHIKAGPPTKLIPLQGHEGAHAYAITRNTAKFLLDEIARQSIRSAIDNDYFIKGQRRTSVPLSIASPTPAVGWLRESTIWSKSANRNYEFIPSFQENYK